MISIRRNEWRQRYNQLLQTPGVREAAEAHAEKQRQQAQEQAMGYGTGKYSGD